MFSKAKSLITKAFMAIGLISAPVAAIDLDPENTLYLDLATGRVTIMMYPDIAPNHVARIKELVRRGYYDGLIFHRVIEGFMAQGGDPDGTGTGGSGQNIDAEFSKRPHLRGTVSMARANDENSADSQFFICYNRVPSLDEKYTIWGRVIAGMEHVDKINKGEPPVEPSKIVRMSVMADAPKMSTAPEPALQEESLPES